MYRHPCDDTHRQNLVLEYQRLKRLALEGKPGRTQDAASEMVAISNEIDRLDDEWFAKKSVK
jgi:hypothetical protein